MHRARLELLCLTHLQYCVDKSLPNRNSETAESMLNDEALQHVRSRFECSTLEIQALQDLEV